MDGAGMEEAKGKGTAKEKRMTETRGFHGVQDCFNIALQPHCPPDDAAFACES